MRARTNLCVRQFGVRRNTDARPADIAIAIGQSRKKLEAIMESETYRREYTNDFVNRWDKLIGWEGRAKGEDGFFESLLDQYNCKSVADIASGTGFHAIILADQGYEVTATDGAEAMVEKTRENARQMDVTLKNAETVDWRELDKVFAHSSFDSLLCLGNAFTHLFDEDDRRRSLDAMMNVLKPGGIAVIDHRNYDKILDHGYDSKHQYYYVGSGVDARPVIIQDDMVRFEYSYPDGNKFHLTMFPLRQSYMRRLMDDAGFTEVHSYGDFERKYDPDNVDFLQVIGRKPRH
jgi:SAM-dependent methyltransferase